MASIKYKSGSSWVDIRNIVYPVGAIYMSTSNTSPSSLFGGTWSQISGSLIGAAGSGKGAGGDNDASMTITNNAYNGHWNIYSTQIPNHLHNGIDGASYTMIKLKSGVSGKFTSSSGGASGTNSQYVYATRSGDYDDLVDSSMTGGYFGGGTGYMPACFGCYMWRRTA